MIDFRVRKNSNIVIVISKKESENHVLMQGLKSTLQSFGLDMSNPSFGFFTGDIKENDMQVCPIKRGIIFSDIPHTVSNQNGCEYYYLPPLYTVALSIEIQQQQLQNAAKSLKT